MFLEVLMVFSNNEVLFNTRNVVINLNLDLTSILWS